MSLVDGQALVNMKKVLQNFRLLTLTAMSQHISDMLSYMNQLIEQSAHAGINLKDAFACAGVPDSTFYRAKMGKDLRHQTASKVSEAIEKLSSLQGRD